MTMAVPHIFWWLAAFAVLVPLVGYWGAGIVLHPPSMSPMAYFPENYGLRYEKTSFKTSDGLTLRGWLIPSAKGESAPTILMCHGWGDNKGELLDETHFLVEKGGYNLFYYDNRSHGESDGKITTMGVLELIDLEAAVKHLSETRPSAIARLGAFGLSMGASVLAMALGRHPEIRAAVLDSPFPSYRRVVRRWAWNKFRAPYVPFVWATLEMLKWRAGNGEIDRYSPMNFIGQVKDRPLFFIAGGQDTLMPVEDVKLVYDAANGCPKEFWVVPEAEHGKCHEAAGPEYESRVLAFFEKNL